ncbi:hypothetical protein IWX81_002214 [Salinibacterium sp. CAN_S4]
MKHFPWGRFWLTIGVIVALVGIVSFTLKYLEVF